jgi:hypothetical protein
MTDAIGAETVEANLAAMFRMMAGLRGGELDIGSNYSRHNSFPTNPMFKGVWDTRLGEADVEAAIADCIAWFRSRHAPYFFWWTGPSTEPAELGARLEARGFLSMEDQQRVLAAGIHQTSHGAPAMAMDLSTADRSFLDRVPKGFAIREAKSNGDLDAFKRVFVETFGIPEWAGRAWVDATLAFGIGKAPWRIFIGRLDGEPVATSVLFVGGGVASPYAVATLPKAQKRGIGAAITLASLLPALELGVRHAVLFSTEDGQPVYRRLGFRDLPGRINRYMWRADSN